MHSWRLLPRWSSLAASVRSWILQSAQWFDQRFRLLAVPVRVSLQRYGAWCAERTVRSGLLLLARATAQGSAFNGLPQGTLLPRRLAMAKNLQTGHLLELFRCSSLYPRASWTLFNCRWTCDPWPGNVCPEFDHKWHCAHIGGSGDVEDDLRR